MSDPHTNHDLDLPDLSDDDIALLHSITTLADHTSTSTAPPTPPFRALFAAYDRVFAEQGLEQEHDGVVFRVLLRVGEAAREGGSRDGRGRVDLVGCLRGILAAWGITILENEDGEGDGVSEVAREGEMDGQVDGQGGAGERGPRRKLGKRGTRRVSFDDARLDETWLSEHSRPLVALVPPAQQGQHSLLSQPARRGRLPSSIPTRRARSISSQQQPVDTFTRHNAPKHSPFVPPSPSTIHTTSDISDPLNPTLLLQPSQTQLEQNAEAFASTSAIRIARTCVHVWHAQTLLLLQARKQALAIATNHDRRTLLKQSLDAWRSTLSTHKQARAAELLHDRQDSLASARHREGLLRKAFTHWAQSTTDQHIAVRLAHSHILRMKYFHRWRAFAVDNALRARSILLRKYLGVWRERLARRQLWEEQAAARFEEARVKQCWKAWFWKFCARRVEGWRQDCVKRRALEAWRGRLSALAARQDSAQEICARHRAHHTVATLSIRLRERLNSQQVARQHRDRCLAGACFRTLTIHARLEPLARTLTLKITLDLERKAFRIWHLHLTLSRQASAVDRQRILQTAWTNWNDTLRCWALGQRIDERIVVEALYRWVLAERGRLLQRRVEGRMLRQVIAVWRARLANATRTVEDAEHIFAQRQQRRRVFAAMTKIHLAVRVRDDARRAGVEFASLRTLPAALATLAAKFREVQQLQKWASDARFYTLSTRTLAMWKEKTGRVQQERKREAYAHVRARIKIRIVGSCLAQWRERAASLRTMDQEAERRAEDRIARRGEQGFARWRDRSVLVRRMVKQTAQVDRAKLLGAAFSALLTRTTSIVELDERAEIFRHWTRDLAVLATALKRLQWAVFTAARRSETADALWVRNRDAHVRNMLRHWAGVIITRREARQQAIDAERGRDEEPESPSLRPASRAASRSRSQARAGFPSSPPTAGLGAGGAGTTTPSYMRTPSRSRRAGRFRPVLPTPAPGTPFGFEVGYLDTVPAPLPLPNLVALDAEGDGALTPQVTPFARKLRAGGFGPRGTGAATPAPALRASVMGRSVLGTTSKSVRFAGAGRFGGSGGHLKSS
ncbi:hypothetical protein LTR53_013088 [Teratosphaeriaceae sp. CCFEE 6253]|nr:hypothetical protein LTR53_013088 [Teratosphaeriaceae sp. CCFEE 6253]